MPEEALGSPWLKWIWTALVDSIAVSVFVQHQKLRRGPCLGTSTNAISHTCVLAVWSFTQKSKVKLSERGKTRTRSTRAYSFHLTWPGPILTEKALGSPCSNWFGQLTSVQCSHACVLPVHTCRHTKSHTGAVSYYRRVTYGMGQLDGTVSRCIGWDGMGWDGPNEAGAATFQATSTGQRRAPPRGNQCCGSGPFLGSWQVSLIKGAGF